jgi:hypothetical protein
MIQAMLAVANTTVLAVQAASAAPTPPSSGALQLNEAVALVTQLEALPRLPAKAEGYPCIHERRFGWIA